MYTARSISTMILIASLSQTTMAIPVPIQKSDFEDPTILDFEDYSGFVGGPAYPDPWWNEARPPEERVRIYGSCGGGDMHVYPYTNNAIIVEFAEPMRRVGADLLHALSTMNRFEVYDAHGDPIAHRDAEAPIFLGIDAGSPIIASARFIDLPDAWATLPVIDNLHFEIPEPATVLLLGLGGFALLRRRRA